MITRHIDAQLAVIDYSDPLHPHHRYSKSKSRDDFDQGTLFCWPTSIEVVNGRYAKRLITSGVPEGSEFLVPLFYRRSLSPSSPLYCTTNLPDKLVSSLGLKIENYEISLNVSAIQPLLQSDLIDRIGLIPQSTNGIYSHSFTPYNFLVDSATLIETLIAPDEPLLRLLLSPFRSSTVRVKNSDERITVALKDLYSIAPRPPSQMNINNARNIFSAAQCLASWLTSPERMMQLAMTADSIIDKRSLHVPTYRAQAKACIEGYRLGHEVLVRRIRVPYFGQLCARISRDVLLVCPRKEGIYFQLSKQSGWWKEGTALVLPGGELDTDLFTLNELTW